MLKRHIDIILIIMGSLIIIAAASLKLYTRYEQNKLIDSYRQYVEEMQKQDEAFNEQKNNSITPIINESENKANKKAENQDTYQEDIKNQSKKDADSKKNMKQSGDIVGVLSIPQIDLCVAIGEGVDKETLKYSVGHFKETAMPGEIGNVCIIGHRSYTYGEFFNRLNEIEINDDMIIEYEGNKYKYKVTEITVVKPEEVSVLDQTEDEEITLITCTPIHVGSHRLIVKGILEKS